MSWKHYTITCLVMEASIHHVPVCVIIFFFLLSLAWHMGCLTNRGKSCGSTSIHQGQKGLKILQPRHMQHGLHGTSVDPRAPPRLRIDGQWMKE